MGWQDVYRKYDEQGNVVDELRFNLGSPEYEEAKKARESGGGKVGDWYIKSGTGDITKKTNIFDEASRIADFYTPKIGVNEAGNGLVITGPSTAINNDMTKQLQSYLDDTFKYADLKSANVADAIEKLNQDVYSQIEQRITDNMLKVPYDEYKEYKEMLQQFQGTNPLKSTSAVPGYTKDGRKISVADDDKKTIAQWLKYYEEHYSAKERAELFMKSMEALMSGDTDFAKYTPYLVMSGGKGSSPVYGFNAGERAAAGIETIYNETVGKLFEGAAQIAMQLSNPFSWQGYGRRNNLNEIAHSLGHSEDVDPAEVKWLSEDAFNEKRDSLIGKNIDELTSDEQAFLAALTGDKLTGYFFGAGRPNPKDFLTEEGDSKLIDANQINQFSYEDYTNARDNLSTISKYSKEITEGVETPFRGIREDIDTATLYAPIEVGTANFIGTMMRFWIESGLISLATGGTVNPMTLSDKFAEGISKILTKSGLVTNPETLSTGLGNFLLRVGAEIPEDIIQTAIDDVLTAHVDEVGTLLTPDSVADNTMQNLVMRLAFTPVTSLWSWAKNKKAIQDAAKAAGMEEKAPESLFTNAQRVKQAADGLPGAGTIVDVTPNSATIRMADGTEEVVDNVAMLHFADGNMQERYPQMYEILRKKGLTEDIETDAGAVERRMDFARKMAEDEYGGDITYTVREGALPDDFYAKGTTRYIPDNYEYDSIIERKIPRDEQFAWYIGRDGEYDVTAKKSMFEKAKADPELRNAALNKMFNEWKNANPGNNNMDFSDWLNTEITLYHGDSTFDIPNDGSGAVEYSLRESVARMFGDKISELKIRPEDTTGVLKSDWTADGIESEGEVFVPYQLVDSAKLDSGDFSTGPQWKPISDIVAAKNKAASYLAGEAPSSGSYSWESPDVPKTYNSEEEVFADRPVGKSMTDIRQWQKNAEAFYMNKYRDEALPKFTEKYPTVDEQQQFVRNMDYLFEVQRRGGADLVVSPKMENVEELSFTKYQVPKSYINKQGEIDLSRRPLTPFEGDIFKENKAIRSSDYKKYYKDVEKVFDKWDSDAGKALDVADRSNVSLEDSENYRTAMARAMAESPLPEVPESLLNSEAYRNAKLNISSLVDSSPLVDFYTMQNDTLGAIRRELRNTGYDNLSPEMKARVDTVDNNISQKLENDMVLYRGETMSDYADSLKAGDQIDSAAWTFASPFEDVTTEYRMGETTAKKNRLDGGVLYRYHTKSGQPAYFAPGSAITDTANDEIMLPRNINGTVTKVTDNKAGKVFGKFVPRKIVDVDVDISGVANGQKVNWGEGNTVIDKIYAEDVPSPKTSTKTVNGHDYITDKVSDGYNKFVSDNLTSLRSNMSPVERAANIAVEQYVMTPGGAIDELNPKIREGKVVFGEIPSIEVKDALDKINLDILIANYYGMPEYIYDEGAENLTLRFANEIAGTKYRLKDENGLDIDYPASVTREAEEAIRTALERPFIKSISDWGNYKTNADTTLYRVVSSEGNKVSSGDISFLDQDSGTFKDSGYSFLTLDEDRVLTSPALGGEGKRYILRVDIPEGEKVGAFDRSVTTQLASGVFGEGDLVESSGHRAGGEFIANLDGYKFKHSGETKDGIEIIDVYKTSSIEPEYTISGSAIGRTYENEGITYTVNEDDVRFYLDNVEPLMGGLREAGAAGIGQDPFTITGYLPHSDYDPTLLTAEDSMQQGVLWRENTGKSTTAEDGSFSTGWLSPDLETRYRTFVNNMLWDSLGNEVVIAKFMEELHADGIDVDVDKVIRLVGGRENLAKIVSKSDSAKAVIKGIMGDGKIPSNSEIEGAAKKAGATDAIHEIYSPIYGTSGKPNQRLNVSLMSKSDWMRSLTTGDGSLYDNGGALIVNSGAEAKYMAKRIFEAVEKGEQLDTHGMFVDFLTQNNRRTNNGASYIADRWMDKIAQKCMDGGITRRELTAELSRLIYNEGVNRLFRFVGRMDTSQLNESNRQALDSLIFRHSMLSKVMNTSGITAKLNRAANALISARMKSLFWLNFKNGVLQASECIRIFTEFKLGDARKTIKRLATDAEFRAEADEWVDMFVPDRFVKSDSSASIGALDTIMDNTTYDANGMTVNKLSAADLKKVGKDFDTFMSKPVEMGEALKNRVLMAGILEEAERKGLSGNEKFSYVAKRFERIGLAANEMGRLNASDNPFFRIASNLKTFQIRQFRMYMNNIADMNGPKEKVTYILKNLGWKAGLAVVMAKLGYSAAATLGFDPFDLMDDDYTGVDEEDYTGLDYLVLSPVGKLFLSGGFTGYINDLYWAGRKTYEDNAEITEQTEERLDNNFWPGWVAPGTDFDNALNTIGGFIPGYTAGKRVVQMNELMDTGWATSKSGTKMYQAPTNPLEVLSGYVFGRSNTPNARAYYQTPDYLQGLMSGGIAGLGQQIGREMKPLRQLFGDTNAGFREFDPIDSQNYTDWFNGTAADEQQWQSGYYYFLNKVQDMQNEYQQSLQSYTTDEQKASLQQSFNERMQDIEDQLERFTKAYESKHPEGIDAKKTKNLINVLNLYQPVMTDTEEEANERSLDAYGQALYRYSQAGLPATTSYKRNDQGEVEEVYSPQLRSALQGEFGLPEEAAAQIRKLYNDKWKDLGKQYRDRLFATKGTKAKQAIQNEYIDIVRQDLDPIVRNYGANIFSNEDVENIIDDVFNSMIPKYGQSAKSYLKNLYKDWSGTVRYTERGNQTLTQINKLLDEGKTAQAKSLARSLLQRVQENRTSLTRAELERLQKILND